MSKGIGIILSIVLLAVTLLIIYQYSISSLAATDVGVDLTGTQYESVYDASVNTSVVAVSLSQYPVMLVGMFAVLIALSTLVLMAMRKR